MKRFIRLVSLLLIATLGISSLVGCAAVDQQQIAANTEAITAGVIGGITSGIVNGISQGLDKVEQTDVAGSVTNILTSVGTGVVDGVSDIVSHIDTDRIASDVSDAFNAVTEMASENLNAAING